MAHVFERAEPKPSSMHLLVRNPIGQIEAVYELRKDNILIGRSRACDVRLGQLYVSREHARITRHGDALQLSRIGAGPLEIQGGVVEGAAVPIAIGAQIAIGGYLLQLVDRVGDGDHTAVMLLEHQGPVVEPETEALPSLCVKLLERDALEQRYQVLSELNRGPNGIIYLAKQKLTQRIVALKTMTPEAEAIHTAAERFVLEAIVMARLTHPNILPIHELGFVDSRELFYTMPYIDTVDIRGAFQSYLDPVQLERAVSVLAQTAFAIGFVHDQGLMHLDLKPGNLLVDRHGHAYVADFGLVCPIPGKTYKMQIPTVLCDSPPGRTSAAPPSIVIDDRLVESTMVFVETENQQHIAGTFRYMAPEQARARPTFQSDCWAIGVMLYQAITGEHPHEVLGLNTSDYFKLAKLECGPSVEKHLAKQKRPEPLLGLIDICDRALRRKQPFASMTELGHALQGVIDAGRASRYWTRVPPLSAAKRDVEVTWVGLEPPPVEPSPDFDLDATVELRPVAPLIPQVSQPGMGPLRVAQAPRPLTAEDTTAPLSPSPWVPRSEPPKPLPCPTPRMPPRPTPVMPTRFAPPPIPQSALAPRVPSLPSAPSLASERTMSWPGGSGAWPPPPPCSEPSGELLVPPARHHDDVSRMLLELECLPLWAFLRRARLRARLRAALARQ